MKKVSIFILFIILTASVVYGSRTAIQGNRSRIQNAKKSIRNQRRKKNPRSNLDYESVGKRYPARTYQKGVHKK